MKALTLVKQHQVATTDTHVAAAWGISIWAWQFTLTDSQRAEYRLNVAHAVKAGN